MEVNRVSPHLLSTSVNYLCRVQLQLQSLFTFSISTLLHSCVHVWYTHKLWHVPHTHNIYTDIYTTHTYIHTYTCTHSARFPSGLPPRSAPCFFIPGFFSHTLPTHWGISRSDPCVSLSSQTLCYYPSPLPPLLPTGLHPSVCLPSSLFTYSHAHQSCFLYS